MKDGVRAGLAEDFEDFFENALSGNLILDAEGRIIRVNARFAGWVGFSIEALAGRRFSELLSIGGKIFHETHLAPLLRMQGYIDEVSLELCCCDGRRMRVMVNALERRDEAGELHFVRLTVFKATERQIYEENLRALKARAEDSLLTERETAALREQFIAVLGHDLRNPLGAITMGTGILARAALGPQEARLVGVMERSARRMAELIENLMDFARFRLGGGVALDRKPVDLAPVLRQVVEELHMSHPGRTIDSQVTVAMPVECDPARIAQIVSNLLANALTHGASDQSVSLRCTLGGGFLELAVINKGVAIPTAILGSLFLPFAREERRSSQNGLGLGLYIASQLAKAHDGEIVAISDDEETRFTFRMPVPVPVE